MQQLKKGVVVILLLLLASSSGAWAQAGGLLAWSAEMPLSWANFLGAPEAGDEPYAAATYAGLQLTIADVAFSGHVTYKVRAIFDSRKSWVHPNRKDAYVLAHEQGHFDIAEAYARRLERKLNSMRLKAKDRQVAKRLYDHYTTAQHKEQERYDKECVHGLNQEKQAEWRKRLDRELRISRHPVESLAQVK